MKRSSSASIVSDKGFVGSSLSSSQSVIFRSSSVSSGLESEPYLPTFNPFSHAAEKKRRHLLLAKIFVHSIPFIVVFCAIVLWLFSDPVCDSVTSIFGECKNLNLGYSSRNSCSRLTYVTMPKRS